METSRRTNWNIRQGYMRDLAVGDLAGLDAVYGMEIVNSIREETIGREPVLRIGLRTPRRFDEHDNQRFVARFPHEPVLYVADPDPGPPKPNA